MHTAARVTSSITNESTICLNDFNDKKNCPTYLHDFSIFGYTARSYRHVYIYICIYAAIYTEPYRRTRKHLNNVSFYPDLLISNAQ